MKPYKTIDEQLAILRARNVQIPRKSFARRVLTYENYYYVINGYKAPSLFLYFQKILGAFRVILGFLGYNI